MSSHITTSGEISVRVLSYAQLQTGDKLSTGHGQKGVTNILPIEDMPFGVTDAGEVIYFDIIMAISSVVNRQTNRQIYEAVSGLQAIRNGAPTVTDGTKPNIEEKVTLIDGATGREGITVLEGKTIVVSRPRGALRRYTA
jgi:DNA-directed RNA polymerase beta subunit